MTDINARIKSEIDSADIVLFLKGTPQAPQCGFSMQVVQILDTSARPTRRSMSWPTMRFARESRVLELADDPQLYIKSEFIGGCDITREMFQSGELARFWTRKASRASRPPRRKIARIFARPRAPGALRARPGVFCAPQNAPLSAPEYF